MLTPVEHQGNYWIKRDDLCVIAGINGGKVRTCYALATTPDIPPGLVTAGSRSSPQVNIVAHIAKELGVPCRVHVPSGVLKPEVQQAQDLGAEVISHRPGYNTVIMARAREDAHIQGYREIPFGMECEEAVRQTASQVQNIPKEAKRIVVPVGSGMSLAGILHGLNEFNLPVSVLGVMVGASPFKRLAKYAPKDWQGRTTLIKSREPYHKEILMRLAGIRLDPIYEAKCVPYLRQDDVLWLVGIRKTVMQTSAPGK